MLLDDESGTVARLGSAMISVGSRTENIKGISTTGTITCQFLLTSSQSFLKIKMAF
jgi:hypothetical protein